MVRGHIPIIALFCLACLCLTACREKAPASPGADSPPAPSETAAPVWSPDEGNASVSLSEEDGTLHVNIPVGTETANLSSLEAPRGKLTVSAPTSLKTLILPAGLTSAAIEPDAASADSPFSLDLLDCAASDGLTQLVLHGEVRSARIPDSLHTLVFYGGDLSGFAGCPSLEELSVLHPTDLMPLRDFPVLGVLALFRVPEDPPWDLSSLVVKPLVILRLMPGITSEEAAALAGASVDALQVSDAAVDDLSFLASMPDTKTLMLGVTPEQPPEILADPAGPYGADLIPFLNTPIPAAQLLEFAARGEVFAFTEINR